MASLGSFDIRARALSELTTISGIDESKTGRHRILSAIVSIMSQLLQNCQYCENSESRCQLAVVESCGPR
jgi:hypothetical protein